MEEQADDMDDEWEVHHELLPDQDNFDSIAGEGGTAELEASTSRLLQMNRMRSLLWPSRPTPTQRTQFATAAQSRPDVTLQESTARVVTAPTTSAQGGYLDYGK